MHATAALRPRGLTLREVLPSARFIRATDIPLHAVTTDWKKCRPGDLYAALIDAEGDGHDYAAEAVARGASAVLAERLLPLDAPQCLADDTREAYARICQALHGNPAGRLNLTGVTGTHGKTMTSLLLTSILEAAGRTTGLTSSLGCSDSVRSAPCRDTTPEPAELARWLAGMAAEGCTHGVIEASSHALAQRGLAGVEFDTAVLTNLRGAHLDQHGSVAAYRKLKERLLGHLKSGGLAVLNADDPASRELLDRVQLPVLTYGLREPAEITAEILERWPSEQTFLLQAGDESIPVRTPLIGDFHVSNCLAAAAAGLAAGVDLATVVRGIERLNVIPGRMERLECGQPFHVYVDAARTPDTLAAALAAVRQVTRGRVLCLFGARGGQEPDQRPLLGRVAERRADLTVLTNNNPREESPLAVIHDVLDGYARPARAQVMPDRQRAIEWILGQAQPGDSVVLCGRGCETVQLVEGRNLKCDDREVARTWLYALGAKADARPAPRRKPAPADAQWN